MAVVITVSNHWKYQQGKKLIDLSTDTFKIILMNTTFTFDKDAHATLADVTADQLATNYGYTQNDKTLASGAWAEDDVNDKGAYTCDDPVWTASGGSIGPSGSAIVYDDSTADDTVVGCIDFGTDYTIPDGTNFTIENILIDNE
jgi:hypothetical protein